MRGYMTAVIILASSSFGLQDIPKFSIRKAYENCPNKARDIKRIEKRKNKMNRKKSYG